ncbi:hypothetical protein CKO28_01440 [Rhodovibrio sodomensis]|uniref:Uncharacterized protein n=1 Tax=Rhodovibrio sodomensis TaxID=1088 RepID=A0ABS1DAT2_9PROT|nr:hypothetical protein [Rhodovibrio sodomensis]MBK1666708.1 hypothetical protein [Rhodovibrio sodomensis]
MNKLDRMIEETGLMPHITAGCVIQELGGYRLNQDSQDTLGTWLYENERAIAGQLAVQAAEIYAANADENSTFAQDLRSGTKGRDMLFSFMRHWLSALLVKERGEAAQRLLPPDFARGVPAPGSTFV